MSDYDASRFWYDADPLSPEEIARTGVDARQRTAGEWSDLLLKLGLILGAVAVGIVSIAVIAGAL